MKRNNNESNQRLKYKYVLPDLQSSNNNEYGNAYDLCAICYAEISVRGKLDCCDHFFCILCIQSWAQNKMVCPICKRQLEKIRSECLRFRPFYKYD